MSLVDPFRRLLMIHFSPGFPIVTRLLRSSRWLCLALPPPAICPSYPPCSAPPPPVVLVSAAPLLPPWRLAPPPPITLVPTFLGRAPAALSPAASISAPPLPLRARACHPRPRPSSFRSMRPAVAHVLAYTWTMPDGGGLAHDRRW